MHLFIFLDLLQLALDLFIVELAGSINIQLCLYYLPLDGRREHRLHDEGEQIDPGLWREMDRRINEVGKY